MVSRSSMVDYYKELGLHRSATSNDIRTAYKRLALIWHPDRNKAKDAEEKFKKIKQAYDVLVDENQRREYDWQQQNIRFETTTTKMKYTQPNEDLFNLRAFDNLMSAPIDPLDILNDIQFFQESDFTSKMMNSPSYRQLYTHLFNSMNNDPAKHRHILSSSPIYLNDDRLFRPNPQSRPNHDSSSKSSPINPVPVIHSTMANDQFLNELIDLYEQQNQFSYFSFNNDPFFNDLTHCRNCHRKISNDRTYLIQHEKQCRENNHSYTKIPSKSVRV